MEYGTEMEMRVKNLLTTVFFYENKGNPATDLLVYYYYVSEYTWEPPPRKGVYLQEKNCLHIICFFYEISHSCSNSKSSDSSVVFFIQLHVESPLHIVQPIVSLSQVWTQLRVFWQSIKISVAPGRWAPVLTISHLTEITIIRKASLLLRRLSGSGLSPRQKKKARNQGQDQMQTAFSITTPFS